MCTKAAGAGQDESGGPELLSPEVVHRFEKRHYGEYAVPTFPRFELGDMPHIVEDTAEKTNLLAHLALELWGYLGFGWKWMWMLARLCIFSALLFPGFLQMMVWYFFSWRCIRNVPYGVKSRQVLDIYLPYKRYVEKAKCPVVIFVTGGAWTIGYKGWGALLGRRLSQKGVLVVSLDYRNFPQGTIPDMLEDVNAGVSWAIRNAEAYGGDPTHVMLAGQSAGAQLSAMVMLEQCARRVESAGSEPPLVPGPSWDPRALRAYVGISGAYDPSAQVEHMHTRGLNRDLQRRLFTLDGAQGAFERLSPTCAVRAASPKVVAELPHMLLLHGTADDSVPAPIAIDFHKALTEQGVSTHLQLYKGKTHTTPLIEDPMAGGIDLLLSDFLSLVHGKRTETYCSPMLPRTLTQLASWVCPF